MKPVSKIVSTMAPLDRNDVDTDQIIPKQFLKRIERTGLGPFAFYDWAYQADGEPDPDFILNKPEYESAAVLVAGKNFGCGSSREHAPWALQDRGFEAVVAPSFADIFYNNCTKIGLLPVALDEDVVAGLIELCSANPGAEIVVDLEQCSVAADGIDAHFEIDSYVRDCLLAGLDDIALTEQQSEAIAAFEAGRPSWMPRTKTS